MTKKKKDTMSSIAMGGTLGLNIVGALPSTASSAGIKAGFSTGVSNVGTALPTIGKIKGTTMVLKPLGKLKSSMNKLNFKGGYQLWDYIKRSA